ncbi:hypothetical protein RclHR1_04530011 [Rhizophagus clarus]|uniref:C2H2-type domain-containing protein n=1 Tax=Rhizophagus clarus TaxID=94130 RepID=A0A2Z6SC78_9GLOM|nr:hypothetical protein RclHR1_04530011 [Rhizophagus clarus]GET02806.1 hypothetical protein GLOIN_2v1713610 [Rhizophagus clarus]
MSILTRRGWVEFWKEVKNRVEKLLNWISEKAFGKKQKPCSSSGASSHNLSSGASSPPSGASSHNLSSGTSSPPSGASSPIPPFSQGPPHGPSFDMNQRSQNESQNRFSTNQVPRPPMSQNEPPSRFSTNQVPRPPMSQNESQNRFNNQVPYPPRPQNEPQSRPRSLSYTCPHRGCARTFETLDSMNRHLSRHSGRNRRR